ncbi:hypothetical protein DW103_00805 [Parabacteroides sp. AM08-6]|nr:hypothetical protein DW103_00805 [Parabacteroides sp. AM08-6]
MQRKFEYKYTVVCPILFAYFSQYDYKTLHIVFFYGIKQVLLQNIPAVGLPDYQNVTSIATK